MSVTTPDRIDVAVTSSGAVVARRRSRLSGRALAPYVFLSPLILFTLVFFLVPLGFSVYLAFTRWNPLSTPSWVGLSNFERLLLRDDTFYETLVNTFIFAGGLVLIGVPIALGLAFVFSRARGKATWRIRSHASSWFSDPLSTP